MRAAVMCAAPCFVHAGLRNARRVPCLVSRILTLDLTVGVATPLAIRQLPVLPALHRHRMRVMVGPSNRGGHVQAASLLHCGK